MADYLTYESIARDDVALNNLTQTLKVVVVADDELASNDCTRLLVLLNDVDVNVVILPELPRERDTIRASCRGTEEEVPGLQQM